MAEPTIDTEPTSSESFLSPQLTRWLIIGGLVVLGGWFIFSRLNNNSIRAEAASIAGQIDFNGISPEDAKDPAQGQIKLTAKEHDSAEEFSDTQIPIAFTDEANWIWQEAEAGKTYDLLAEVYYKDLLIKKSQQVVVTAPASEIILIFNITNEDIPDQIKSTTDTATTDQPEDSEDSQYVSITGIYTINGYVPAGSTISVYGRQETNEEFVEAFSDVPAVNGTILTFDKATAGVTYEIQAELYTADDTFIGQSAYITVTAPAQHEVIVINSTAQAPDDQATISGTVTINGPVEQNSTVLMLQRKQGESEYQAFNRYPANRTVDFKWTDAAAGATYDITAALQVNENNTATGTVATVSAPASEVDLTIDTNFNLASPEEKPKVTCGEADETNHYNAKIELPQIEAAKKYGLQVGTSAGANNVFQGVLNPGETKTVYINQDSPHFARYAYTACTDCELDNSNNWSGWSPTLGFQCPQE